MLPITIYVDVKEDKQKGNFPRSNPLRDWMGIFQEKSKLFSGRLVANLFGGTLDRIRENDSQYDDT